MFSFTELQGQSPLLHKSGTVEITTNVAADRKPAWLVALKLLGVLAMVAVGAAIAVPTLFEFRFPLWQAAVITAIGMLVYTAVAFFIRPEPNTDNLGFGGGLANDPFQYSDDVNRFLWKAHCVLGPGRFTAHTLIDLGVLLGLVGGASDAGDVSVPASHTDRDRGNSFDATRPLAPLDPQQFAKSTANASYVAGQIQLDSQRFLSATRSSAPQMVV
jgi:hypothetical protein